MDKGKQRQSHANASNDRHDSDTTDILGDTHATKGGSSVKAAKDPKQEQSAPELGGQPKLEVVENAPLLSGILVPGVTQTSPTRFIVQPGLSNLDFRSWFKKLPESQRTGVLSAYLRHEHDRICESLQSLESQYETLTISKLIAIEEWDQKMQATSTIATAVCLHYGTWWENHQWLVDETKDGSAATWASLGQKLVDKMSDMLSYVTRAVIRARQLRDSSKEEAEFLGQAAAIMLPNRLRQVRGDAGTSKAMGRSAAFKHKQEVSRLRLASGVKKFNSPPSPLRQERGTSPETTQGDAPSGQEQSTTSAGSGAAKEHRYKIDTTSGASVVDMSLVVERLVRNELKSAQDRLTERL